MDKKLEFWFVIVFAIAKWVHLVGSYDMPNVRGGPLGVMFHLAGTPGIQLERFSTPSAWRIFAIAIFYKMEGSIALVFQQSKNTTIWYDYFVYIQRMLRAWSNVLVYVIYLFILLD